MAEKKVLKLFQEFSAVEGETKFADYNTYFFLNVMIAFGVLH